MSTTAERIKEALELRGLKQSDLVQLTGIGKSSISTYLSGAYEPKQQNIFKIAQALNVSEGWLMGLDVDMKRNINNNKLNVSEEQLNFLKDFEQLDTETQNFIKHIIKKALD